MSKDEVEQHITVIKSQQCHPGPDTTHDADEIARSINALTDAVLLLVRVQMSR